MNEGLLGCLALVIGVPAVIFLLGGIIGICIFGWHEIFQAYAN